MGSIQWDGIALARAIGIAAMPEVTSATQRAAASANAMGSAFKTGIYHRDHKSPHVGETPAHYGSSVRAYYGTWPVGIVYTGNYAAMCDNAKNNTLLNSLG
jgi:hypothetical protein